MSDNTPSPFILVDRTAVKRLSDELSQMMVLPDVVAPVINMNGSSPATLIGDYVEVMERLRHAADALAKTLPHGRDYQTAPSGTFEAAVRHHRNRVRMVAQLLHEFEQLAMTVQDQGHKQAEIRCGGRA